jgi:hypothetical protein
MGSADKTEVLAATRRWLRPLVHVLLRCGVTYREFTELARNSYVQVATEKFGRRGRPTNVSRVALLTGLSRRDVRRARETLDTQPPAEDGFTSKGSLALSAWHQQGPFLDSRGQPRELSFDGPSPSFVELTRAIGATDVAPATLLKELKSAGAVEQTRDGRLRPLQRNFIPQSMDANLIRLWGSVIADIGRTYEHNLLRDRARPARLERAAVNDRIDPAALPAFRAFLEAEGQAFLERADAWLTAHSLTDQAAPAAGIRLGVGVYHVED